MGRRATLVALTLILASAGLVRDVRGIGRSPDLPDRLTSQQFWELSTGLSEPAESFMSDNLVSNEMSFAQVIPELAASVSPGGVYLGVGPEQNFTFLAAMQARMGFVIDIRRENLLLHLLYKALFELSRDRATFVSLLFSRTPPQSLTEAATIAELMDAFAAATPEDEVSFGRHAEDIRKVLVEDHQLPLSSQDLTTVRQMHRAFYEYGPAIGYATTQLQRSVGLASYANLMRQVDSEGRALSYLGTEASYRFVRELQARNLLIPVVGNFAGPKALRAIGTYVRSRGARVQAFYLSNVEDYLGRERVPQNGDWSVFCRNVATLPIDERSVFIRPLGLAAFDAQGKFMVSSKMQIGSPRAVTYPVGTRPALPPALFPMAPEIKNCGGYASPPGRPAA